MKGGILTQISEFFAKNYRFSFLVLLGFLFLGFISYSQLLPREGLPPIQQSIILVNGSYLVDDPQKVSDEVVSVIEGEILKFKEVEQVISTTTNNSYQITTLLRADTDLKSVSNEIKSSLSAIKLPEGASFNFFVPQVGKILNEFDIVLTVYGEDKNPSELQEIANVLAKDLVKSDDIVQAKVIPIYSQQPNPITGEQIEIQNR